MARNIRRSVAFFLAMALVIAGMPLAHAMPCASAAPSMALHEQHGMADAGDMHAEHHGMMHAAETPARQDQSHAAIPCKCLNCSLCVASCVAPFDLASTPERVSFAVSYDPAATGDHRAFIFIDPGIPILAT